MHRMNKAEDISIQALTFDYKYSFKNIIVLGGKPIRKVENYTLKKEVE